MGERRTFLRQAMTDGAGRSLRRLGLLALRCSLAQVDGVGNGGGKGIGCGHDGVGRDFEAGRNLVLQHP